MEYDPYSQLPSIFEYQDYHRSDVLNPDTLPVHHPLILDTDISYSVQGVHESDVPYGSLYLDFASPNLGDL